MFTKSKNASVPDIFLNIGHLLDHFMMLIFAKLHTMGDDISDYNMMK